MATVERTVERESRIALHHLHDIVTYILTLDKLVCCAPYTTKTSVQVPEALKGVNKCLKLTIGRIDMLDSS